MTSLEAFEDTLHGVLSEIDGTLEERWVSFFQPSFFHDALFS